MQPVNEYAHGRPSAALRPYVAFYTGYRQRGLTPAVHRGLPSPYLTLIVTLDEPLVVAAHPDRRQPPGRYASLLGGLHVTPALITHDGCQSGVQVAVRPLGCRALLGLPAGEIAAVDVDVRDVLGAVAEELLDRVRAATGWPERFATVDAVLARRLSSGPAFVAPEVTYAWDTVLRTGGSARVAEIVAEIGWSARHLTARFRTEVGLGVKQAARVVRFDVARRRLQAAAVHGTPRLADLAATAGYFDQAHLAREFGELAGCSPTRWLAEEIGNVQALPPEPDQNGRHDRQRTAAAGMADPAGP